MEELIELFWSSNILNKLKEDFPRCECVTHYEYNRQVNYIQRCLQDIDFKFAKYGNYELSIVTTREHRDYRTINCNNLEIEKGCAFVFLFNTKTKKYLKLNSYNDIYKAFSKV